MFNVYYIQGKEKRDDSFTEQNLSLFKSSVEAPGRGSPSR